MKITEDNYLQYENGDTVLEAQRTLAQALICKNCGAFIAYSFRDKHRMVCS